MHILNAGTAGIAPHVVRVGQYAITRVKRNNMDDTEIELLNMSFEDMDRIANGDEA